MKRLLLAILMGLTLFTVGAGAAVDPRIRTQQSAFIQCNLLWSAKLSAQPGNPYLLARKAQQLCAGQDAAYERVMRSVLPYKEIADRYMRKVHASQLKSNASMIVKARAMIKKRKQ